MNQMTPLSVPQLLNKLQGFMSRFQMYVHPVVAMPRRRKNFCPDLVKEVILDVRSDVVKKMIMMPLLQTPETRLIQYDCGKLQVLVSFILLLYFLKIMFN